MSETAPAWPGRSAGRGGPVLTSSQPTKRYQMDIQPAFQPLPKGYQVAWYGMEKLCTKCREYWPADAEFFFTNPDGTLKNSCKACWYEMPSVQRRLQGKARRLQ
ncbi:hypothetical protein MPJ00_gp20 [Pseudomonas phage vB_PaeS_PAO1_HW12]|nr:hypothetical protein MPJ00_gp20 [Pseudomonas phage vB_PaeS_PAO1_HW12]